MTTGLHRNAATVPKLKSTSLPASGDVVRKATHRYRMKPNSDDVVYLDDYAISDAAAMFEADHDVEHRKRFDFPSDFVPSLEHSERVIRQWMEARKTGTQYAYAVRDTNTSCLLGGCEIRPKDSATANLSYWTYRDHRGRGIATRAVSIACRVAAQLGITRLEILVDKDNIASQRVATSNDFIQSGELDGRLYYFCNPVARF